MVSKAEVKAKLWVVENPQNISSKSMRAHGSKFGVKNETPKSPETWESCWENWDFPSPKIRFSSLKIWFSSTAFRFPRNPRKSSSTAFRFLQRLSDFFTGFPLSETAFRFLQRLSNFPQRLSTFWEIRENRRRFSEDLWKMTDQAFLRWRAF